MITITTKDRTESAFSKLHYYLNLCDATTAVINSDKASETIDLDELDLLFYWSRAVFYRREYEGSRRIDRKARRILCILIILVAFSGVSFASPKANAVDLAKTAADVEQCEFVADVDASAKYILTSETATKNAEKQAIKRIRIRTHRKGGDTVLVTSMESGAGRALVEGVAYRCGGDA